MVVPDLRSLSMRENARFRQWQAMYFERRALNPNLPGEHFYQTKFEDALEIEVMRLHSPKKPLFFEEIAFLAERMTTFYMTHEEHENLVFDQNWWLNYVETRSAEFQR